MPRLNEKSLFDSQTKAFGTACCEVEVTSVSSQRKPATTLTGMPVNVVAGLRWEETDVTSTSQQAVPNAFVWESNNDFSFSLGTGAENLVSEYTYSTLLPNLDVSVDITDSLKGRVSFSKTLARPEYSQMYTATTVNVPSRITHV